MSSVYEVTIRGNLVQSIHATSAHDVIDVPDSPLAVTSELATNHQRTGSIDGRYRFHDPEQARTFSLLAMDFVKRLLDRRISEIEALDTGEDYAVMSNSDSRWG